MPRTTIADRLVHARNARFVGRRDELALFDDALRPESPSAVVYVHGPGGVGKSALLHAFADRARAAGARPILVDGRDIEPSPHDVLRACGLGSDTTNDPFGPVPRSDRQGPRPVLLIDTYERLSPIDPWVRRTLVPQLPAHALVVVASRQPPSKGWRSDPGWTALMRVVALANLPSDDARTYLRATSVPEDLHDGMVTATQGYPLALALLADVANRRPLGTDLDLFHAPDVVRPLLGHLVEGLPSPDHRVALDTCALVRTTTHAHLRATLGRGDVDDVFDWLRQLPYVQEGLQGLFPHDLARDVLAADVRRRDPARHRALMRTLLRITGEELCSAPAGDPPRQAVLDLLHSFRSHAVHNWHWHFGKLGEVRPEPATADDRAAILRLIREDEGQANADLAAGWLDRQPDGFRLDRDGEGTVESLVCWLSLVDATPEDLAADPATRRLWDHVRRHAPLAEGEQVTVLRFVCPAGRPQRRSALGLAAYEGVRRAFGLPGLRWDFLVLRHPEWRSPLVEHMGYDRVDGFDIDVGDRRYAVFAHDWRALPAPWAPFIDAQDWARRQAFPVDEPVDLPRPEFDAAVRQALRDLHRPDALARNPLARTRLVVDGGAGGNAAMRLADLLGGAARTLTGHPRDEKLHRALDRTYFRPAPTQEKAAELLGLPLSTYRRHLTNGITRLTTHLWAKAQARPG